MLALIKVSRPLNLLIVGLTQALFYFLFFVPLSTFHSLCLYSNRLLFPFVLVTVIITACGYYINDYFDFNSDLLNQKKNRLSRRTDYLYLYFSLFIIGFILSVWIAFQIQRPNLALIYIGANILLFLYSTSFKKKPLIGNMTVAAFSSGVILILLFAEYKYLGSKFINEEIQKTGSSFQLLFYYIGFVFLISLIREIVKDIEDMDGDRAVGYNTLPIAWGVKKSKWLCAILSICLIVTLMIWYFQNTPQFDVLSNIGFFGGLILPIGILILGCLLTQEIKSFRKISHLCKALMLSGLIFLILFLWI